MKNSQVNKLLILKDSEGRPIRIIQPQSHVLHLVKNIETRRIELMDSNSDYKETHILLQEVDLQKSKGPFKLNQVGTLQWHEGEAHSPMDPKQLQDDEPYFPIFIKWTSAANGAVVGILVLLAFLIPSLNPVNNQPQTQLVTIQIEKPLATDTIEKAKLNPPAAEPKTPAPTTHLAKQNVKVVPRTNKNKSLLVKQTHINKQRLVNQNTSGSKQFQRLGSIGAIANAIKGTRDGMGSGLRGPGGGTGGFGKGAGMGRGNGTMGHGHDSGGGYEQALYGKGLIAGQVGGGGGGFGSGWGEGTRGSGGYGTKGKGGGHSGFGNSKVGSGASTFAYPVRDEAVVEGGLDRDAIELVVMKNIGQITYCYELGLQQKSGLRGRVSVDFRINGQGRVSTCSVASSSLRSNQVESCIIGKIKTWKFPHPVGGVNVDVNYPFALQRVSQN